MALGKRSLMNEHMLTVLSKVSSMDPEPVQKSYLYYSQAEKEYVDYLISVDLLKEVSFTDAEGSQKKGYVLGDFGRTILPDIVSIQMKLDLQERSLSDPSPLAEEVRAVHAEYSRALSEGSDEEAARLRTKLDCYDPLIREEYMETVSGRIEELDSRGNRKMETITKWKQQRRTQN